MVGRKWIRGGVGQNLSYYIASVHPNITVNGQSHANIGVGLSIDSDVRVDSGWYGMRGFALHHWCMVN